MTTINSSHSSHDSIRFMEARGIIERMLDDWPYQPPEIITAEREAFRRWLADTRPAPAEYMAAMSHMAGGPDA